MNSRLRIITGAVALLGASLFGGCGGGGSSSSSSTFAVEEISVPNGAVWQINRRMEFLFNQPVDFGSVNLNTINIAQQGGAPAVGEFSPLEVGLNNKTIFFQPACPTLGDYSDAGLLPGSVSNPITYVINIVGSNSGGATVRSVSGEPLLQSQTTLFTTPSAGSSAGTLFIDTVPGPPKAVLRTCVNPNDLDECDCDLTQGEASYIELGEDPQNRIYFRPREGSAIDAALGAVTDPCDFEAPLNLYSNVATRVAIVLHINQPVDPAASNVNADTVQLEYQTDPTTWQRVPHTVELIANCTQTGSIIRVVPLGLLPQGRLVRTVLAQSLTDLVSQSNSVPLTVGSFIVSALDGPGGDEVLDEFTSGGSSPDSFEDTTATLSEPRAVWGNGKLEAAFAFDGTGGPGGTFDWHVDNNAFLDTTFSVITNSTQSAQQTVVNGRVDVHDFIVKPGVKLTIQGPNPCKILASGRVEIGGIVTINGNNNKGVATLDTTNQPEAGAGGNCGGGRGGTASYLTTQSTPGGESGYGAFNLVNGGGGGGESSYNISQNENWRRPGGGGGGMLGKDTLRPAGTTQVPVNGFTQPNPNNCPDQIQVGLDGEDGFPGWPTTVPIITPPGTQNTGNNGALHAGLQPKGGTKGPRPFLDADPNNDFWGAMLTATGTLIQGELLQPWAGAGGGAGGNAVKSSSFPANPFSITGDEKGSGGGGGAGSLTILALGQIKFLQFGRIEAKGGTGGGGENSVVTGGITRIGGGSGGGSGGHIILQSASEIDFQACRSVSLGGIYALGGQGGAGANNQGGSPSNGTQTAPNFDALPNPLPPNSYPSTTQLLTTAPCSMSQVFGGYGTGASANNLVGNIPTASVSGLNGNDPSTVVAAAGGDGGPGIIQFHVPTLDKILPPTSIGETLYKCVKPPPIGATPNNVNTPALWNQLLPIFGRRSMAQSKWIELGLANVTQASSRPDAVEFVFAGTDAQGFVLKAGTGINQVVAELPPILTGTLAAPPTTPPSTQPYIVLPDKRTIVLPGALFDPIFKPIYTQNPLLIRRFSLELTHGTETKKWEVATATYDSSFDQIHATVSASGLPLVVASSPLVDYAVGDAVVLRQRYFRASTEGIVDALPSTSTIKIEFQATSETPQGTPDLVVGPTHGTDWDTDVIDINAHPNADNFRFVRFRVTFDILNPTPENPNPTLNFNTPIPALDFFRIPFKF